MKVRVAKERLYTECVKKKYKEALGRAWSRGKDDMAVRAQASLIRAPVLK